MTLEDSSVLHLIVTYVLYSRFLKDQDEKWSKS